MNRKIKSLIMAGVLVVMMGGNVHANEPLMSSITNPQFEEGTNQKVVTLQNGAITLTITEEDGYYYYLTTNWDSSKFKVISVKTYFEEGYMMINETQFRDGDDCDTIIKEDGMYKVNLANDVDKKLVKVEVMYEPIDNDGNGIPDFKDDTPTEPENPPVEPEEPEQPKEEIVDPETGDKSLFIYCGVAAVAVVGLCVVNRKKDEDK